MKPLFITCEGCEGSGKSTFVALLVDALVQMGVDTIRTREPGGTLFGEKVRQMILHDLDVQDLSYTAELLLFLSARAEHVDKVIDPALRLGKTVVCDRYIDSTMAYQAYGRGLRPEDVAPLCLAAVPKMPDYTFCIDIDFETAQQRLLSRQGLTRDKMEQNSADFHERVRLGFLTIAKNHPARVFLLDGRLSQKELIESALLFLRERMAIP